VAELSRRAQRWAWGLVHHIHRNGEVLMKRYAFYIVSMLMFSGFACSDPVVPDVPETLEEVPRVTAEALKARLDAGEAILVVDVRSAEAYRAEHIAGAVHIPLAEVERRLAEFPKDRDIVFYCT